MIQEPIVVINAGGIRMFDKYSMEAAQRYADNNLGSLYIRADWVIKTARVDGGQRLTKRRGEHHQSGLDK